MSPTKDNTLTGPLVERSPNTFPPTKSSTPDKFSFVDEKTAIPRFEPPQLRTSTQPQDQAGASQNYISPSDAIRSPTTKKLSEIKGKRFMNAKPKTLFAQTVARENIKAQGQSADANNQQP